MSYAKREGPDQPAYPLSLIKAFSFVFLFSISTGSLRKQRRPWSKCAIRRGFVAPYCVKVSSAALGISFVALNYTARPDLVQTSRKMGAPLISCDKRYFWLVPVSNLRLLLCKLLFAIVVKK